VRRKPSRNGTDERQCRCRRDECARIARLEENLGATKIQLTADDLRVIDRAVSHIDVYGARYPEHLQMMVGR
jgi:hypothetical protein